MTIYRTKESTVVCRGGFWARHAICALCTVVLFGALSEARGQEVPAHGRRAVSPTVLFRLADVGPRGPRAREVLPMWPEAVHERTAGEVALELVPASPDHEIDVVRDVRAHRLHGACLRVRGIVEFAPSLAVLQASGLFRDYARLNAARTRLHSDLAAAFERHHLTLVGWADHGHARLFASRPIATPADLSGTRVVTTSQGPVGRAWLGAVGATAALMPQIAVLPALRGGSVDAIVATSTEVMHDGWAAFLTHGSSAEAEVVIGACVMDRASFDGLDLQTRRAFLETSRTILAMLERASLVDDRMAFDALGRRGLQTFDGGSPAWRSADADARRLLAGREFGEADVAELVRVPTIRSN